MPSHQGNTPSHQGKRCLFRHAPPPRQWDCHCTRGSLDWKLGIHKCCHRRSPTEATPLKRTNQLYCLSCPRTDALGLR
jgi:hypothetical protein